MQYVIATHLMRWLNNFYDFRFKRTTTEAIGIHPTKAWLSQLVNFKNAIWTCGHFRKTICNKILFETWKNARKTYGMLQTAFGTSCRNRESVSEWHKRFKEVRESVRDFEWCGRSKEVRTPELIGQIKNFIDKDRRVSTESISAQFDVSVGTVHSIIREELKMRNIFSKFVPSVLREDQKDVVKTAGRWSGWSIQIPQVLMLWWPAMKAGSTTMTQRPRDRVPSRSMLALPDPRRPDRANPPTNIWWSLFWKPWHDLHTLGSHWTVNKE